MFVIIDLSGQLSSPMAKSPHSVMQCLHTNGPTGQKKCLIWKYDSSFFQHRGLLVAGTSFKCALFEFILHFSRSTCKASMYITSILFKTNSQNLTYFHSCFKYNVSGYPVQIRTITLYVSRHLLCLKCHI